MSAQELITKHLDIWTSAHKTRSTAGRGSNNKLDLVGIKKLRELILELAVRGKLVPQDSNDEPASELLNKIAAVKEVLLSEGKIKREKSLPELDENEIPIGLPSGWKVVHLQNVCAYIQRGKGPAYAEYGQVRVVSQKCVQWSGFDIEQARYVNDESLSAYQEERYLQNNDLLWNSTGTGTVGRIVVLTGIEPKMLVADSHVTVIRPIEVNSRFLCAYISAPGIQNRIEPGSENALVSGSTNQVELNTSSVMSVAIPIPPLPEQHRIVAKVDELMAFCDQLEKAQSDNIAAHAQLVEALLATLTNSSDHNELQNNWQRIATHFDTLFTTEHSIDQLKQTILQLAVMGKLAPQNPNDEPASELLKKIAAEKAQLIKEGKIKKEIYYVNFDGLDEIKNFLPTSWGWIRLSDTADIVRGGSPRPAGDPKFYGGSIPFLKVGDVTNNKGKYVEGFNSTITEAGLTKTRYINTRTVLLSNSGATLGIPAICTFPTTFNDGIAAFVEKSAYIFDEYLYLYLKSISKWLLHVASQGQGQPNLNTDIVKSVWFPLAPLEEQHRIVTRVDELMALCDTLKANLQNAQTTQLALADAVVEQAVS